jgi:hypothetical protein
MLDEALKNLDFASQGANLARLRESVFAEPSPFIASLSFHIHS